MKEFTDFRYGGDGYDDADFYAEFTITEPHTCQGENGSTICGICGKTTDVYTVVGNAECMGSWDPKSTQGIMRESSPGVFKVTFANAPAGDYELKVVENGSFDQCWGDGVNNYCFTNPVPYDIEVTFTLKDDVGVITATFAPTPSLDSEDEAVEVTAVDDSNSIDPDSIHDQNPAETADAELTLPVVLLLVCTVTLTIVWNKTRNTTK